MKIRIVIVCWVILCSASCEIKGVDTTEEENTQVKKITEKLNLELEDSLKVNESIEKPKDTLRLPNGIMITYFHHGKGKHLQKGDMIKLDFRSKLENGKIFDGNNFVKKPNIPFLVGWNQQTKGWDLAMKYLRVGDDVDVFIPAKYARGEKGLGKMVPPNANVIISMNIVDLFKPTIVTNSGVRIWKYDEFGNPGDSIELGDEVLINYWVSSQSNPRYDNDYKRGHPTKLIIGDKNIVPGLREALLYGREGDRLMIIIPPSEAYGSKGYLNLVKPNEAIYYDLQIAKVTKEVNQAS